MPIDAFMHPESKRLSVAQRGKAWLPLVRLDVAREYAEDQIEKLATQRTIAHLLRERIEELETELACVRVRQFQTPRASLVAAADAVEALGVVQRNVTFLLRENIDREHPA